MDACVLNLAAALALSISWTATVQSPAEPAVVQGKTSSVAASVVGRWLYDPHGNTIGSVRDLADGGRTAVVMVGSYFRPGSYEAWVPASALSVVNGHITLQAGTIQALNVQSRSRG